ncbi:MAG: PIN domain-containing protein [Spirochaetales bacterium]
MAKVFLDTNLLIHTVDTKDAEKHERSRELLRDVSAKHLPVISTQVLQEFYNGLTTKLKVDKIVAKNILHGYRNLEIVSADLAMIEQAVDISMLFQLSFWDSLIVAAAEQANCSVLFTEDLNDGQSIRGVRVVNPFKTPQT